MLGAMRIERIFRALEDAEARYVVVGGLAVVAHGFARLTGDIDLVIDSEPDAARHAIATLCSIGFSPRAPIDPLGFADAAQRKRWLEEQDLQVLALRDPAQPLVEIDLLADTAVDFGDLFASAELHTIGETSIRIASIEHLITTKKAAGQPHDWIDIEALEALRKKGPDCGSQG